MCVCVWRMRTGDGRGLGYRCEGFSGGGLDM